MLWTCPKCSSTRRAPSKPRKNDVRRYCLTCSDETGKLVERVCPALEKRREKRIVERVAARIMDVAERAQRALEFPECLHEEWKRMCRLPTAREGLKRFGPPTLILKGRAAASPSRGRIGTARFGRREVLIYPFRGSPIAVREAMLHELAHHVNYRRVQFVLGKTLTDARGHGDTFRAVLKDLVEEYVGDGVLMLPKSRYRYAPDAVAVDFIRQRVDAGVAFGHAFVALCDLWVSQGHET